MGMREIGKEIIEINLDSLSNFNNLLTAIDRVNCNNKIAIIKFETNSSIFKIQPLNFCSENPPIWCSSLRDVIYLTSDSITVSYDLKYNIDSLKPVLKRHLRNIENNENYPKKGKIGFLSLHIDSTKNISHTKNLLLKIITDFNEIDNDSLHLNVLFENHGIIEVIE